MKDPTDWIVTLVLLLCSILLYEGWKGVQIESLEAQALMDLNRWENAREVNREKWERHCLRFSLGYANSIPYTVYETGEAERVYEDCVK